MPRACSHLLACLCDHCDSTSPHCSSQCFMQHVISRLSVTGIVIPLICRVSHCWHAWSAPLATSLMSRRVSLAGVQHGCCSTASCRVFCHMPSRLYKLACTAAPHPLASPLTSRIVYLGMHQWKLEPSPALAHQPSLAPPTHQHG